MKINYQIFHKLDKFNSNKKQKILILKGLIDKLSEQKFLKSVNKSLSKPTKTFKQNNKIIKFEYNDSSNFDIVLKKIYKELYSKKFISLLKKIFNLKNLYPDGNKYMITFIQF